MSGGYCFFLFFRKILSCKPFKLCVKVSSFLDKVFFVNSVCVLIIKEMQQTVNLILLFYSITILLSPVIFSKEIRAVLLLPSNKSSVKELSIFAVEGTKGSLILMLAFLILAPLI